MIGPIERLLMNSTMELAVGSRSFEDYKQNFDALIKNFGKIKHFRRLDGKVEKRRSGNIRKKQAGWG